MAVRALVVDDSPVVRKGFRYHLAIYGVRGIDEAENASQGLVLFREHAPNLVIMDLMMPESNGITSRELFDTIKREAPATPIMIVSSIPTKKSARPLSARAPRILSSNLSISSPSIARGAS
jgi:YesN/AraC family two-component response regulator